MKLYRAEYLVDEAMKTAVYASGQVRTMLLGHSVKVFKEWRDQPFGKSKPDLNGEIRQIVEVLIDPIDGEIQVLMRDCRTYAYLRCPSCPDRVAVRLV